MYRITVTADFDGDRHRASRAYAAISEAIGQKDGDEQTFDIEWIGGGDEPRRLACAVCGRADASFVNPGVGDPYPTCWEHVQDGYIQIERPDYDDDYDERVNELLGVM